jgi:uncharacterized damage-inducible protein DinB
MTDAELKANLDGIRQGPALLEAAVDGLDNATLDYKPSPQKWSIREVVTHLADVELIYGYRMRQMIADKNPTIAPIEQDDWASNLAYRDAPLEEMLQQFRVLRQTNLRLLQRLTPADLSKGAFHPERGRVFTLEELIGFMAKHHPNHIGQIERLKEQLKQATP